MELGALLFVLFSLNGQESVVLAVLQAPGSNALDLQANVKEKMDELSQRFPAGMSYNMFYDTTRFVSAAMEDVVKTLVEALILVVLVVFIFLQSWRATIIPIIAIPVSLVATLTVMYMLGFSLNMLSLLGMVLAIGLVVDDAIVVVENVERQLEAGLPPLEAAKAAMQEVTGPIIATTGVLLAVFVPVAFIPGVAGQLYNQFALTVAISFAISAFNSLTLSPALSAVFLRHRGAVEIHPVPVVQCRFQQNVERLCRQHQDLRSLALGLDRSLRCRAGRHLCAVAADSSTFLPVEDQGYFFVVLQLPDGASVERTAAVAKRSGRNPAWSSGCRVRSARSCGFLVPDLRQPVECRCAVRGAEALGRARSGRERDGTEGHRTRGKLIQIPEALVLAFDPPSIQGLGATGGFEFQVEDLARTRRRCARRGDAGSAGRSAKATGTQPVHAVHHLQHLDATVQLRPRPQQGEATGPQPARHLLDVADLSRLALRQRLQPVRAHIPRHPASGAGGARFGDRHLAALCAEQFWRHGAAEHARRR